MTKKISIVTPTFNEEDNIAELCAAISKEMKNFSYDYEHIVIDNNSTDKTIPIIKKIAETDKNLKIIINSRNFGHLKSPVYGILQSSGDATILINSDFQEPVELISQYIKEWEKGEHKIILGQRSSSDTNKVMNLIRTIFYKGINKISEVPLMERTWGTGLFSKEIVNHVRSINDPYPYFRGMLSEITADIKLIPFHQNIRKGGVTKNNFYTLYDIAMLGIVKHSRLPLRFMILIGFLSSLISFGIALFYLMYKILYWGSFELGIAPLIIGIFFFASIQILLIGIIGEYIGVILLYQRNMPLAIEKERINFD